MILYNFSFDDTNATVLAGHNLCLRSVDEKCCVSFLVICSLVFNGRNSNLLISHSKHDVTNPGLGQSFVSTFLPKKHRMLLVSCAITSVSILSILQIPSHVCLQQCRISTESCMGLVVQHGRKGIKLDATFYSKLIQHLTI